MFAALALAAAIACSKDTVPQPRSLFSGVISALHVDEGSGNATVKGEDRQLTEFRLSIAACRFPGYTLGLVAAGHVRSVRTGDRVVGGVTSNRYAQIFSSGYEIQRRWRDSSVFHPMVGFGMGTMHVDNYYYTRGTADTYPTYDYTEHGRSTYYAPSVGLEASLFKYMTIYAIVGSRYAGNVNVPGLAAGDLSGKYTIVGFGFGKFR